MPLNWDDRAPLAPESTGDTRPERDGLPPVWVWVIALAVVLGLNLALCAVNILTTHL